MAETTGLISHLHFRLTGHQGKALCWAPRNLLEQCLSGKLSVSVAEGGKRMGKSVNWYLNLPSGTDTCSYVPFAQASHVATLSLVLP